jgi:N utilization substance protein B
MSEATDDRENASEQRARLRRTARLSAVQALYQMELTGAGAKSVVMQFRNHQFGYDDEPGNYIESDEDFFEDLLKGMVARQDEVDSLGCVSCEGRVEVFPSGLHRAGDP